jgi:hypothetical protein
VTLSNYLSGALLDHTLRNNAYTSPVAVYLALFTTIPDAEDVGGVEVAGGSYARQPVTFGAPGEGLSYNTDPVTFSTLPAATIVGAGLYDAAVAGNLLHFASLSAVRTVLAGSDFVVSVGDVVAVMR